MKIVKPNVEVYFHYPEITMHETDGACIQTFLERVGRTCYKSEDKITQGSASKFIKMLKDRGHHAMLEHCAASVKFICDRGISHELVRHRIASFAQESTRYCNYTKDKFGGDITVIEPPFKNETSVHLWDELVKQAEQTYRALLALGESPQIARSVLPTCLKTEIWITANLREWMHFFELRCASTAHPQMVEVMKQAQKRFADKIPEIFANETQS